MCCGDLQLGFGVCRGLQQDFGVLEGSGAGLWGAGGTWNSALGCSSLHSPFAISCSVSDFIASLLLPSPHAQMRAYATTASSFYH